MPNVPPASVLDWRDRNGRAEVRWLAPRLQYVPVRRRPSLGSKGTSRRSLALPDDAARWQKRKIAGMPLIAVACLRQSAGPAASSH